MLNYKDETIYKHARKFEEEKNKRECNTGEYTRASTVRINGGSREAQRHERRRRRVRRQRSF